MSQIKAIEILATEAAAQGASDVHLDLDADAVRVRLRIDGLLRTWLPSKLQPDRLREAAWSVAHGEKAQLADWRIAAHIDGERLALRLRAERVSGTAEALAALGLGLSQSWALTRALERPGGLVVVAGPPQSGRSTTIAAMLGHEVRTRSVVSIGMAVPHAIDIASEQDAHLQPAIERALTLDPDVLVLGDLPDQDAAVLAFQVAASGRRVFLRSNAPDAIAAIERLRMLKVERLQLAAHLRAVTAQRLARRLCRACRRPVQASNAVAALLGFDPGAVIHQSTGCAECGGSGKQGRIAAFEAIAVDGAIARLINDGADAALLSRHAFLSTPRLDSAARAMVREGLIDADEALHLSRGGMVIA